MQVIIQPGTFIHQQVYMPYMHLNGVFIEGPTNENTMLNMNCMTYMHLDGVFVRWMYF